MISDSDTILLPICVFWLSVQLSYSSRLSQNEQVTKRTQGTNVQMFLVWFPLQDCVYIHTNRQVSLSEMQHQRFFCSYHIVSDTFSQITSMLMNNLTSFQTILSSATTDSSYSSFYYFSATITSFIPVYSIPDSIPDPIVRNFLIVTNHLTC